MLDSAMFENEAMNCGERRQGGGTRRFALIGVDDPHEVDADPATEGVQAFSSPTAGHKWNFDGAGIGTHTGFDGFSMWDLADPRDPQLLTTTGDAGRGTDPAYEGYNDFIHHNSFRPNAEAFRPGAEPSLANGNVLLVTEEDHMETDCSAAGSFQTWQVWDQMWLPVYNKKGQQTGKQTSIAYSIDLVRGLDVYDVNLPGGRSTESRSPETSSVVAPVGLVASAGVVSLALLRRRRTT